MFQQFPPDKLFRLLFRLVFALDIVLVAVLCWIVPSAFYGSYAKGYVLGGAFILFPLVVFFGIGTPIAVISALRDAKRARSENR